MMLLSLKINKAKIAAAGVANLSDGSSAGEAVEALVALGFSQSDAAVVVAKMDKSLTVDEMIRLGLKQLSRNL